ncbi:MAG: hypothetical protein JOZ39_01490, partial [Chloroflexi bacterium]|nr:hypothetical protein [Chloroflexota bacterium]
AVGAWLALSLILGGLAASRPGPAQTRWPATIAILATLAACLLLAWTAPIERFPHAQGALVFDALAQLLLPPLWTGTALAMAACLYLPSARYDVAIAAVSVAAATAGILSANPLLTVALLQASALFVLAGLVVHAERPGGNPVLSIATSIKYVTLMVVSAACLIMALLLANFYALNQDRTDLPRVIAAVLVTGFGLAVGAMPFYFHLPDILDSGPAATGIAMLGPLQTLAFVYLIRTLGNGPWLLADEHVVQVLTYGAAAGALVAGLLAFGQRRLPRLLAFNSIREVGWIALGIATASRSGWSGALILLGARCLIEPILVVAAAIVEQATGDLALSKLLGLGRLLPITALGWLVAAMGSVGIPPAMSFWGISDVVRGFSPAGAAGVGLLVASGALSLGRLAQVALAGLWKPVENLPLALPAAGASSPAELGSGRRVALRPVTRPRLEPLLPASLLAVLAVGLLLAGLAPRLFSGPVAGTLNSFPFLR